MQIAIRAYGSDTSGAVRDSTTEAIDRFFDLVDKGVDAADHVLNRGKQTADLHQERRGKRREIIEAVPAKPKASKKPAGPTGPGASTTALARKPHFYIVEAATPTGVIFVVTDGGNARTECSTREFAEKILRALEAA